MAELSAQPLAPKAGASKSGAWTAVQTREQFVAIAWLRWRILINSFRRKGGTGELIGRILLFPLLAGLAIGPSLGVGAAAFYFTHVHKLGSIALLLWITFGFCQLLNIQLGQPGSTFDPTELIRFPLRAREYIAVRLCFGLLSPANVIGTLMSVCIALGILVSAPGLWLYAIVTLAVFAAANVLFSRMIFAWVDRWLATRRAREIFTALLFTFSIGVQWANFTFNPAYNHGNTSSVSAEKLLFVFSLFHRIQPLLAWLPPQITAASLVAANQGSTALFARLTAACALYAALFYTVFALRTRTEFRGENLSDAANAVSRSPRKTTVPKAASLLAPTVGTTSAKGPFGLSPTISAMLGKEFLFIRRNTGVVYGLAMPIILVLLVASKFATRSNAVWVFPATVAYTMLAISTFSYNAFGLEGAGSQFYFLAPVRIRDVVFAKNLLSFATAFVEIVLTFLIISYIAGMPPLTIALSSVLWAAATMLLTTLVGNRRSITAPKRIAVGRMAGKQVSQLSGLIAMGILMGSAALGVIPAGLALYFHVTWVLLPVFAVYAGVAAFFYERSLRSLDHFAIEHREELFTELCKAA